AIEASLVTQLDHYSGPSFSAEASWTDFHDVIPGKQITRFVGSFLRGQRYAGQPCRRLQDCHGCPGHWSASWVDDCSQDCCVNGLCLHGYGTGDRECDQRKQITHTDLLSSTFISPH